jgi:peroxiredoxin
MALTVGEKLPHIAGQTADGFLDLAKYRGSKAVVLWTYPKDATSG